MSWMLPLPVVVPLLAAALVAATDHVTPSRVQDAIGIAAAAIATVFAILILLETQKGLRLHWFGGWTPVGGKVAIGISFAAEPLGAGMAALACGLVLLALVYSWTYTREASRLFDVLMLVFCAGMAGFSLTGDIFNMFVWFELMGVAAYTLAGFKIEELGPLQGAINFAVTNTIAAYMVLLGTGLLYARTGALNLAQIGRVLALRGLSDRLVIVALTLVLTGFMVKAAIAPFHFWLADAHAVAPAPVCVLFSGAMVELGLLAVARIYWTVFDGVLAPHHVEFRSALVWLGVVTAVLGAVMCFLQRHLKRMLAYSTISHAGIILTGIGMLDGKSLAGAADLVLAHGLLKGGLFLVCGVVLLRLRDIDELRLHGAGRTLPVAGVLWLLATLGLVGIPYVGVFLGHSLEDDGAVLSGYGWLPAVVMVTAALSAAAMLRAGARVFLGWGPTEDPLLSPEPPEEPAERDAALPLLLAVPAVAIALGLAVSLVPGLQARSERAADQFRDRTAYAGRVLEGVEQRQIARPPFAFPKETPESIDYGIGSTILAFGFAALGLWRRRLPAALRRVAARPAIRASLALRVVHSGIIGDYVLWLTAGVAVIGGVWAFTLR